MGGRGEGVRRSLPATLLVRLFCPLRPHSVLPCSAQPCPRLAAALAAQTVKNPPAMQEMWVQSLGGEDPLEKEMAAHSSILAWEIPGTEEPGGLQSMVR